MRTLLLVLTSSALLTAQTEVIGGGGGGGGSSVTASNQECQLTAQTSCTITHNLNTTKIVTQCKAGANGDGADIAHTYTALTANSVTIALGASSTGRCRVNGTGGVGAQGPQGPQGPAGSSGTDTGSTSQSSFQVDSGNSGPRWKNQSGSFTPRNAADNAAANLILGGLINAGGGSWIPPKLAIGTLPAAGLSSGLEYIVTGVAGPGLCSGSGPYTAKCASNGSVWEFIANLGIDAGTWADGQLPVASGTTGRGWKPFTGTGVVKVTSGIPGLVSGSTSDCVKVDGTSGTCGSGSVTAANVGAVSGPGSDGCITPTVNGSTLEYPLAVTCLEPLARTPTGYWNMSGAQWRPPELTFASLPTASSNTGKHFWVTDANAGCTAGGGTTTPCWMRSNGTAWVASGGTGGGMADPGSNGVLARTGLNTTAARTMTCGPGLACTNGDGFSGNPQFDLDPLDTSVFWMVEEFISSTNNAATNNFGSYFWRNSVVTGGGVTEQNANTLSFADQSVIAMTSTQANGRATLICCGGGSVTPFSALNSNTGWDARFTVFTDVNQSTEHQIRIGFMSTPADTPTNFIGVRLLSSAGCTANATDSFWSYETISGGTGTVTPSAQAFATSQTITFRMRSIVAGTILFSYRLASGSWSSETAISTNVPSAGLSPGFQMIGCNSTSKTLRAMRFALRITGLPR